MDYNIIELDEQYKCIEDHDLFCNCSKCEQYWDMMADIEVASSDITFDEEHERDLDQVYEKDGW